MPYPFWDVATGYGILMAVIAVVHVFVSHFAIGGGLYLVVAELRARRAGDQERLDFVKRLSRFFILVTVVFGALTGVAIWFVIGLLNPKATEALIHNFVWGWATEWTFFVVEILAAILYYYGWERMSARNHLILGWIYFAAAWLSLFVINGIITFMLTPGAWIETGGFWDGFFNPTFWPSLVLRTGICLLLAGLFALFVAAAYRGSLKARLVRSSAGWAAAGLVIAAPCWLWYKAAIPAEVLAVATERLSISAASIDLLMLLTIALAAAVVVLGFLAPRLYVRPVAVAMLALGLAWFGSFEWFREAARKPYVIHGYMYGNGMRVDDAERYDTEGLLPQIGFRTDDPGADLYRVSCRACHTMRGYNPIAPAFDGTDLDFIAGSIQGMHVMKGPMPPFMGTADEARLLAGHIWERVDQRPLAEIHGLQGVELGARSYEVRCGRCHVIGGHKDKTDTITSAEPDEVEEFLEVLLSEQLADEMPVFSGGDAERAALIQYLKTWKKGAE